jgi:hypothetical protein
MAFHVDYEWLPFLLPNFLLIFAGLTIMLMFMWALLPVPLYFLEVFVKLSLDLVMLPLFLLGWLFSGWKIFPNGASGAGVKSILKDVMQSTCGMALVGLFAGFAVLFLNEIIGDAGGGGILIDAIQNNKPKYLMDGLMFNNNSIIDILMAGIFTGMFMNAIPSLTEKLFKDFSIPKDIREGAENLQKDLPALIKHLS